MKSSEVKRFASLYEHHLKLLKLQSKSDSTISAYSRAIRKPGLFSVPSLHYLAPL
jgi:hypothetical protein